MEEIGWGVFSEAVECCFETHGNIGRLFLERVQYAHQNFPGVGTGDGLRTETDFACDDERAGGRAVFAMLENRLTVS